MAVPFLSREHELHAFVHVDEDALAAGPQAEGPLAGRLVAVKDNIAVRGAPWACGSATRRGLGPATEDAEVVRRVRAAGGVVAGTTNTDELAMGASTETSSWGSTRNPYDPTRTAGGSSGGSAAAVAAYGVLAVGTDTGGSIREPAAMCGVVGVAPSHGSVPTSGVVDFAPSLDRVGPIARTVAEAALLHEVIAGVDGLVAAAERGAREPLGGRALGVVVPMSGHRNAPEVLERFEAARLALLGLGATVLPVSVPRFGDLLDVYVTVTCVEALPVLEEHAARGPLGEEAASRLRLGRSLAGTREHAEALAVREEIRADVATALKVCSVLVSPTVPLTAPLLGRPGMADPLARPRTDWWTVEANLAGIPAASVPAGLGDGLPVGVQLMTAHGEDARLYRVGAALEAALGG
ncbi:amidase [Nocardioides sp. GXQ0305]|uniref:amidase n=1 Tax=Nocardioides sp. GXQ0305 TaxID=3423912 RepID=UPI003D7E7C8E